MREEIGESVDGEGEGPEEPAIWERNWAVLCHLGGFAGLLVPGFGQVLGPLVLWLVRRDQSAYVDHHGREAVNFQFSL